MKTYQLVLLIWLVYCLAFGLVLWEKWRKTDKSSKLPANILEANYTRLQALSNGIPPELPYTVQMLETGHLSLANRAGARSRAGARGVMQIMPFHAKGFGLKVSDLYHAKTNIRVGCRLLGERYKKYGGDIEKVLASYNGGGKAVDRRFRAYETRSYVKRGLKLYKELKNDTIS